MAMSPGPRQRGTSPGNQPQDPSADNLNPMQEPLGSMDRPIPRTSDDNDVNLASNGVGRRAGNLDRTGTAPRGRGFTTTFVIVAAILVAAFLVALYLGADRYNQASGPSDSQAPVADSTPGNAPSGDTTGSTTPAEPPESAPAGGGNTGTGNTGTGTTPPANP